MFPQESDTIPTLLVGESRLLDLISTDAPLAQVLNQICAALDVQVGNVVSVILSTRDGEHSLHALADRAVQFGLYVFCCSAILSESEQLLGTLETYICLPRTPTVNEARLIQRASQLAALAIQIHGRETGSWSVLWPFADGTGRNSHGGHLSEN